MYKELNTKTFILLNFLAAELLILILLSTSIVEFGQSPQAPPGTKSVVYDSIRRFSPDTATMTTGEADSILPDAVVIGTPDTVTVDSAIYQVATGFAKGVDISHYQKTIDWEALKQAGLSFVYAKATQGNCFVDRYFRKNWEAARTHGLIRGAYHFMDFEQAALAVSVEAGAEAQAYHFLARVPFAPGDLPPMLDVEQYSSLSADEVARCTRRWLDVVARETGTIPVVYMQRSFWIEKMKRSNLLNDYPLWIADINKSQEPHLPSCWVDWCFWQYKTAVRLPGITTTVFNMDTYHGTPEQLREFVNQYGFKTSM